MDATTKATTAQPRSSIEMVAKRSAPIEGMNTQQRQMESGERVRGGGAAKDCFLGALECFFCFESCKVCCECFADIICCPCEVCGM